ncbi:MAG TPA: tRNA 2-thiouridine(34) synthase MnmA [Thermoanaerobaculia bacterium]|nr:tRNA 2-thiouridine(34) synthase MnmA [Thermoanaerobaculia bacterium]
MSATTAVAMSGGLDSSVVALLLARRGEPVVGLSMLLWDASGEPTPAGRGRCCGALDLGDARRVAQQVGIAHYTLRMAEEFRHHVVDPFVDDYLAGRTPSPCVRCNTWVKFDLLLAKARAIGASRVATGHYARILEGPDGPELHTARDAEKDQSYYLFELTAEQLAASCFPLGELSKGEVRELAREAGLVVAEKGESMEVCFVSGGVAEFVERQLAEHPERYARHPEPEAAEVVAAGGVPLGPASAPYYRYTVGQRRGLGLSSSERLYVLGVEPEANRVRVGREEELRATGLLGERLHWISPVERFASAEGELRARVKIRSRHPGVEARLRPLPGGEVEVLFDEPQTGVAPGQAAVFYRGTQVLGGCWIRTGLSREPSPPDPPPAPAPL